MKKTFFKNLFRDIKNTPSRFLSIVIIIAVGVAFYSGVRATSPAMKASADHYLDENNFMDFKLISTLGLTEDDKNAIVKQKEITRAEGAYSLDGVVEKDDKQLVLNINSLPDKNGINDIRIIEGRRAEKPNEIVVEEHFMEESKLKLNEYIVLKSGTEDNIKDDLKETRFKIVGTAISPLYLSQQRQISSVGNGDVRGFVYILPSVFESEVYTEIYARAESGESKDSIINNEDYNNYTKSIEKNLEDLGKVRNDIRYEEVYTEANEKLLDAEYELEDSKQEAEKEIADGYRELDQAQRKINNGRQEIKRNENIFNKEMADGKRELENGKREIENARKKLLSQAKEIENGRVQIREGKKKLEASQAQLDAGKQEAASQISAAVGEQVKNAEALMNSEPENEQYAKNYQMLNGLYQGSIKGQSFNSMYSSLKNNNLLGTMKPYVDIEKLNNDFFKAQRDIDNGRAEIASQERKINEGQAALDQAPAQIEASKKKIAQGERELEEGRRKGLRELEKARVELNNGQREVDENLAKLKTEEEKANKEIADAEKKIAKNRDKLKDIKDPDWYVLGRGQNLGYETYRQDSDRIDNIGKVFPLIFFLVAALVSLTTMTRMVQEQRTEIGTFKALGYSSTAIISHYLIYSLTASITGSVIGVLLGYRLFPHLIIEAYSSLYAVPETITPFITSLAAQASLLAIVFTTLAAAISALDELREVPASLMRPKPPKAGKKILLERIDFIWSRLKFTSKVTARNLFRYKQRLVMTVIGIAACTGLMLTGFGLKDGIIGATEAQFNDIYKYDMQGTLNRDESEIEKKKIKTETLKDENVESVLFVNLQNGLVKSKEIRDEDSYVVVPENKDQLNEYINLFLKDKDLNLDNDGVIITEKLSRLIDKKTGDTIEITIDEKIVEAKISDITEQYIQHYIYMSPKYYEKISGEKMVYNNFYGKLKDNSEKLEDDTSIRLKTIAGINSIGFKNNSKVDYDQSMESIDAVVFILIASAGVLAFVVIYNLTNINITERRRELATIKLLGFYDKELAAYIYRENVILTFVGSFVGIFIGMILNKFVLSTAETNIIKFLGKISPRYFLYSIILTVLFSAIVNLAMYKRFSKIDMIESLKSAE